MNLRVVSGGTWVNKPGTSPKHAGDKQYFAISPLQALCSTQRYKKVLHPFQQPWKLLLIGTSLQQRTDNHPERGKQHSNAVERIYSQMSSMWTIIIKKKMYKEKAVCSSGDSSSWCTISTRSSNCFLRDWSVFSCNLNFLHWLVGGCSVFFFIFRFEELFSYAFFPHIFLFTLLLSMKFKRIWRCEAEFSFIAILSYTVGQQWKLPANQFWSLACRQQDMPLIIQWGVWLTWIHFPFCTAFLL